MRRYALGLLIISRILAVSHPGEESAIPTELTSHWPEGGDAQPRAGVIAIVRPFNAMGNM
jgi:hypothetical protein